MDFDGPCRHLSTRTRYAARTVSFRRAVAILKAAFTLSARVPNTLPAKRTGAKLALGW